MEGCRIRWNIERWPSRTLTHMLLVFLLVFHHQIGNVYSGPSETTHNNSADLSSTTPVTNSSARSGSALTQPPVEPVDLPASSSLPAKAGSKSLAQIISRNIPSKLKDNGVTWRNGRVCSPPLNKGRTVTTTFKVGLKVSDLAFLQNCSIIEGNLVIKWMMKDVSVDNYTAVAMHQLVEITGYLLIYRVHGLPTLGTLFPNLRVIRGNEVFWSFAMALYENDDIASISLPHLSYVGREIAAMVNPELCYYEDYVDWKRIIKDGKTPISINNRVNNQVCRFVDGCPRECPNNCWDRNNCQKECSSLCPQEADDDKGYGCADDTGKCCHTECLGGCTTSGSASACYACKHFYHDNQCMKSCPPTNALGEELLEYKGRRCVTRDMCLKEDAFNKFHDGKCLKRCPLHFTNHKDLGPLRGDHSVHVCVPCPNSKCDIVCKKRTIQTVDNAKSMRGCTIVNGYLEIAITNSPGNVSLLYDYLSQIREVVGYVKIVRSPFLETLDFLKNLRIIRGRELDSNMYALYIVENPNLESLWNFERHVTNNAGADPRIGTDGLPILRIENGTFYFQQNEQLCYDKINRLLELTTFDGTLAARNGSMYRISSSTHDDYAVSPATNGQNGNCYNNSLFFEVFEDPAIALFPSYNFSAFQTRDDRVIISYVLYYRAVADDEEATYYKARRCDTDQRWTTYEVKKENKEKREINNVTYYSSYIAGMDAFTRYALYVQTYTTEKIGRDGARSPIIYFKTQPSKPEEPRRVLVLAHYQDGNNVLEVSWDEPDIHNGILDKYVIFYRMKPWKTKQIYRKNFCEEEIRVNDVETTTPKEVSEVTDRSTSNKAGCECKEEVVEMSQEQKDAELRYNFENALQNTQFRKNPGTISGRAKRAVQESEYDLAVAPANKTVTQTTTMTILTTEKPAVIVPSMASVQANQRRVLLFNLEPNMEYSIEVMACHAYDEVNNVTRCSKRALNNAITKADPTLDYIKPNTFKVEKIESNGEPALNISWRPSDKTNGPILSYTLLYWIVNDTDGNATSQQDLKDPSLAIKKCITAKEFADAGYYYIYPSSSLIQGAEYNFKVRMRTIGTTTGNFTPVYTFQYGKKEPPGQQTLIIAMAVVVPMVILLMAGLLALYWCKVKRKKPLPLATLHNSYNIDYMDTDNIYIPDEWELERSKVKIGISLGQGSFGMVYEGEAKDLYNTDKKMRKVAIKTVNDGATIQDRISFLNEASRMKAFSCHHIVQLLGVVSQGQPVLVIMELMALGDLKNYLRMHRPDEEDNDGRRPPTLREILQMAAEIADGMAYLSDRKFVHRDLAARNCMVAKDMTVKIGDFGMTRDIYDSDYYRKGGKGMLPVRWMSPESLKDGLYTSKSDVWSYGVVLWEMATLAAQPYQGFSNEEVLKFVIDSRVMEMPDGCPIRLYDMMTACWQYYPRYRPTFKDLLLMLQGDVKKTFFSVSWYYSQRDDDLADDESESLNPSESQPLHPSSVHSLSDHHLEADHDLDDDHDLHCSDTKELVCDLPPLVPKRFNSRSLASSGEFDLRRSEPMLNGHHSTTGSESTSGGSEEESLRSDSLPSLPNGVIARENFYSQSPCKAPPSYNAATILDQPIIPTDPSIWSSENASKTNSCNGSANGSANGPLHFGTNTLTSAC